MYSHIFSIKGISAPTTVQVSEMTDSSAVITMTTDVTEGMTNVTLNNLLPNRQYGVTVSSLSIGVVAS